VGAGCLNVSFPQLTSTCETLKVIHRTDCVSNLKLNNTKSLKCCEGEDKMARKHDIDTKLPEKQGK
jgi:hypothetical protein